MSRILWGLLFLTLASLLVAGSHWYLYRRLAVDTGLPLPWRRIARITLTALGVGMPLSMLLGRLLPPAAGRVLLAPFFVWMGVFFLLLGMFLATDLVRLMAWGLGRIAHHDVLGDPARRQFLSRVVAGVGSGAVITAAVAGVHRALGKLVVRRVEIPLLHLPDPLDGLRIVQLTDLHIGPGRGGDFVKEVVDRTAALAPDLVVITGDLVDGSVASLLQDLRPLAALRPPLGVFFVTGNHEYYSGAPEWVAALPRLGIRVLRNEHVLLGRTDGQGQRGHLTLAGVDDYNAAGLAPGHGHDVAGALRGRDPQVPTVLLAHQPRSVLEAARLGADLVLSGHTHGGQVWPWHHLVLLQQPYVSGLHRHRASGPNARPEGTWIYVSEGTGFWGPPLRLGTTAEITEVTLRRAGRPGHRAAAPQSNPIEKAS